MTPSPPALALVAILAAGAATAADKPVLGPPPAWVKPTSFSQTPAKVDANASAALLLQDLQVKFTPDEEQTYWELAAKVQTPQGLQMLGQLAPVWNPDTDELTIHKVHIIRDGKVIDAMAGGKTFTVLRRETKLEQATLDGDLTAELQIEDLRVGDILDVAWTIRRSDPVLKGHIQEDIRPNTPPGSRVRVRMIWPDDAGVKVRTSAWVPALKSQVADGQTTQTLAIDDSPEIVLPKGAPARFQRGREIEISNFASWADVAAVMAPLFGKAAQLDPNSPLQAEVKRIAALSKDPKVRADAALALVQTQVRYVALTLNNGGLVPAAADVTWTRRFGDCKGKTALLLALLRALDIDAEPALVSSNAGDGMNERLPGLLAFDHVIVHARIAGRDYWLDGTRPGDGPLDTIVTPQFHWALPVRTAGSALIALNQAPAARPESETSLRFDATAGLVAPAKVHAETILRGDAALLIHFGFSQMPPDQRDQALRKFWTTQHSFGDISHVSESFDPIRQEERFELDGTADLDWSGQGLEALGSRLATRPDLARDAGPHNDAPYTVQFPIHERSSETIVLPNSGKGFTLAGGDISQTVAGVRYTRQASLKDGVVTVISDKASLAPEFPAAQAPAVTTALADLAQRTLFVAPPGAVAKAGGGPATGVAPTTAAGYVTQGAAFRAADQAKEAMAAYDQALVLDPKSAAAMGGRAAILAQAPTMMEKANVDADAALKIDPNAETALVAKALLAEYGRRWPEEQGFLDKALKVDPHDAVALAARAGVELEKKQETQARVDFAEARRFGAGSPYVLNLVCYEAATRGFELDQALTDCDAAIKMAPKAPDILDSRGFVLLRLKRDEEAIAQYDTVLTLEPFTAESLLGRSFAERRRGRTADADRDLQAAMAADPKVSDEFKRYGVTD
jgi:tetratricopeptide (TPR) repeat protein/transglutaminase-like putative cysteine protease